MVDYYRTPATQKEFAERNDQDVKKVTSFADATKLSMETTVLANATGFGVARRGMVGPACGYVRELAKLLPAEAMLSGGIVDYSVGATPHTGAFVVVHEENPLKKTQLAYYKLGDGPFYVFYTPFHLPHIQIPSTIARAVIHRDATVTPLAGPSCEVVTIAKRDLKAGERLDGVGGFCAYGLIDNYASARADNALPIALSEDCVLVRDVRKDDAIGFDDVKLPATRLSDELWLEQCRRWPVKTAGAKRAGVLNPVHLSAKEQPVSNGIVVIGSGMAGFGAATRIAAEGGRAVVYDQNSYYGGHTASFRDAKGFLFDLGPHISFTKDERVQKFLAENVDDRIRSAAGQPQQLLAGATGSRTPCSCICNGLPPDLIVEIITDFVEEQQRGERPIENYEDWLVASYGRKFAETFPMQYARKYHLTTASNMSTDWLGPRMYRPSLEELLRGALAPWTPDRHYISHFRYPKQGGFYSYLEPFPQTAELQLGHKVVSVDPTRAKVRRSQNGKEVGFDALVSSVPLPDLIPMIVGAPADVRGRSARSSHARRACS